MPKVTGKKSGNGQGPTVRLATLGPPEALVKGLMGQPTVRLAHKVNHQGDRTLEEGPPSIRLGATGVSQDSSPQRDAAATVELLPALLVSYVYLEPFLKNRHRYHYRDWVMDSGAFSAHNSGTEVKLQDYINCCKGLMATDPKMTEVFSLDVIGDWKASLKNTEEMWRQGVQAIPTFHFGSPWPELKTMAKDYPKIALGGLVGQAVRPRDAWIGQCFARVWPKKIHGFGLSGEKTIMRFPFHSVDATNWELGPCRYGRWKSFGGALSVRGSRQNLRSEVEWYLALEQRARERWKKEMAVLAALDAPSVRLSATREGGGIERIVEGLKGPDVRLALGAAGSETCYKDQGAVSKGLGPSEHLVPFGHENNRSKEALGPTLRLAGQEDNGGERLAISIGPNVILAISDVQAPHTNAVQQVADALRPRKTPKPRGK
jgi:hypothetical protein